MTTRSVQPWRRLSLAIPGLLLLSACNSGSVSQGASSVTGATTTAEAPGGGRGSVELPAHRRPLISNLVVSFPRPCTFTGEDGELVDGTIGAVRFSYRDADGNVTGGTVVSTATFHRGQAVQAVFGPNSFPVPSRGVTVTGTTAGTVTIFFCIRFWVTTAITETVQLVDAAGLRSNVLTRRVARPPRVPEVRRSGDPPPLVAIRDAHPD